MKDDFSQKYKSPDDIVKIPKDLKFFCAIFLMMLGYYVGMVCYVCLTSTIKEICLISCFIFSKFSLLSLLDQITVSLLLVVTLVLLGKTLLEVIFTIGFFFGFFILFYFLTKDTIGNIPIMDFILFVIWWSFLKLPFYGDEIFEERRVKKNPYESDPFLAAIMLTSLFSPITLGIPLHFMLKYMFV